MGKKKSLESLILHFNKLLEKEEFSHIYNKNKEYCIKKSQELFDKFNISQTLKFKFMKSFNGLCEKKKIIIDNFLLIQPGCTFDIIDDLLYHEIAHAIIPFNNIDNDNHGHLWKLTLVKINPKIKFFSEIGSMIYPKVSLPKLDEEYGPQKPKYVITCSEGCKLYNTKKEYLVCSKHNKYLKYSYF